MRLRALASLFALALACADARGPDAAPGATPSPAGNAWLHRTFLGGRVFHATAPTEDAARKQLIDLLRDYCARLAPGRETLSRQLWDDAAKLVREQPVAQTGAPDAGRGEAELALPLDALRAMIERAPWLSKEVRRSLLARTSAAFDELRDAQRARVK